MAILTVLKAGFIGSGRYGNGLVVARLPDGSWSAPSAIGTGGAGVGGQIGFELTDFVFILNDAAAVKTFSQQGSLTLGGNVSIAAGPIGRNAEAAGAASMKGVAGIFSYSKTKGLFAGVSLEGSAIIERRDANAKLYNQRLTAREILEGAVPPPQAAAPLMSILNSRVFAGRANSGDDYNDIPVYDDRHDDVVWEGRRGSAMGEGARKPGVQPPPETFDDAFGGPSRSTTWNGNAAASPKRGPGGAFDDNYTYSDNASPKAGDSKKLGPGRPAAPKPMFGGGGRKDEALALFTFDGDQEGDLSFKKGDIITVTKKTDSDNDWW